MLFLHVTSDIHPFTSSFWDWKKPKAPYSSTFSQKVRGPCIPKSLQTFPGLIVTYLRVLISIPAAKPVKRKSTISPVNEKVSGLQHCSHLLPLRRIIVRSGFQKGITLLRSRSLRTIRVFRKQMDTEDSVKPLPFTFRLIKPFIRLIQSFIQFPLTWKIHFTFIL